MNIILKYFPDISDNQKLQFSKLYELYYEWNNKINVISRKDIENLYERHVLHSLGIASFFKPYPGTSFIDVGTGGGFPGIPLSIMFPDCKFHLVDSIAKKLKVIEAVATELSLKNISTEHIRIEQHKTQYDYVLSRAVMVFPEFVKLTRKNISKHSKNKIANGIIYLKGGDINEEIAPFPKAEIIKLKNYFEEEFFETKKIVFLPV